MKLPIETWLEQANCPEEAMEAFRESILAYKGGANRAGLSYSYTGMMLWIKDRLLVAQPPNGYTPGEWQQRQNELRDDNVLEKVAFDLTQVKKPKAVFSVDDQLRLEMQYWKDRRNDCAHYKRNMITEANVQAFWSFLQSSIARWVPNGSAQDLLARLIRHYDPIYTAPGTDVSPLAQSFQGAIPPQERSTFLTDLEAAFTSNNTYHAGINEIIAALLNVHSLIGDVVTWLLTRPTLAVGVLRLKPGHVLHFNGHPAFIRSLWHTYLFQNQFPDLHVFAAMLRNGVIPPAQIQEAVASTVERVTKEEPTQEDNRVLEQNGFWVQFRKRAIDDRMIDNFGWANAKADFIAWWIENSAIDQTMAEAICRTFDGGYYPRDARVSIKAMLSQNPTKRAELATQAALSGATIPQELT